MIMRVVCFGSVYYVYNGVVCSRAEIEDMRG